MSENNGKPTISLAMIVRDCAEGLDRALKSVEVVKFDEIIIVDTGSKDSATKDVALKYGAKVYDWVDPNPDFKDWCKSNGFEGVDCISNFADARNFSFSKVTSEYAFWMDSDDVMNGAENFRKVFDYWNSRGATGYKAQYVYSKTEDGRPTTIQIRERIVKPKDWHWTPWIHEVLITQKPCSLAKVHSGDWHIEHDLSGSETMRRKDRRNLAVIEYWRARKGDIEPRLWKHRGQHLLGLGQYPEAIESLKKLVDNSGWPLDVYHAMTLIGEAYRRLNQPLQSIEWDLKASEIHPEYPTAYVGLALAEMMLHRWIKSLHYSSIALGCTENTEELVDSPAWFHVSVYGTRHRCFFELGRFAEALGALKQMAEIYPNKEGLIELAKTTQEAIQDGELFRAYTMISDEILKEKDEEKLEMFAKASPKKIHYYAPLAWLGRKQPEFGPAISFVCPGQMTEWSPASVDTGIGGSEEAAVFMARELADRGHWVDVFCNTKEQRVWGGKYTADDGKAVEPYREHRYYITDAIRPKDSYDVMIGWRSLDIFKLDWTAKKKILWLHDIPNAQAWPKELVEKVDYVLALSEYHREMLESAVPADKLVLSANGLHPDYLVPPQNDPKRVVFTSNPARGLDLLLEVWPEVYERTGAVLHVFYGFTKWHKTVVADNPAEVAKMDRIIELIRKCPGVVDHGMVGQKKLALECAKAGIWAYPTNFPEISCISAMRAQAMGAIPVTTKFGALDETVQYGVKLGADKYTSYFHTPEATKAYKEELIAMILNPKLQDQIRADMVPWAREKFQWKKVADQWEDLFKGKACLPDNRIPAALATL